MSCVTVVCDAHHSSFQSVRRAQIPVFLYFAGTGCGLIGIVYASASPWRCRLHPFGLCANLRLCDESTDSQAVAPHAVQKSVNQLRNIALGGPIQRRNIPTGRSVWLDSGSCPTHPQTFPQGTGVQGSGFRVGSRHARVVTGLGPAST